MFRCKHDYHTADVLAHCEGCIAISDHSVTPVKTGVHLLSILLSMTAVLVM